MTKQILYPRLIARLFSTTIDLFLLAILGTPIINFISRAVFILIFRGFFIEHNISLTDIDAIMIATRTEEFANSITTGQYFTHIVVLLTLNLLVLGGYFVTLWTYQDSTVGKIFLRMKIVDANTFAKPTKWQYIKRFLFYCTAPLGMWSIIFNSKRMALHDKLSGTLVIKS